MSSCLCHFTSNVVWMLRTRKERVQIHNQISSDVQHFRAKLYLEGKSQRLSRNQSYKNT